MQEIIGYTIKEVIAEGDRFTVLRAIQNQDQRKVVLKLCRLELPSTEDLTSLQHEYLMLKKIDSPLVIKVYDLIKQGRQLVLVLEDIDGKPLKQFLEDKPLDLETFFNIALQLTNALNDIHLKKIIHKDLNPKNILIDPNSLSIKIIDFGFAMQLVEDPKSTVQSIVIEGNLEYISPEQTGRMNHAIDYRTDFYSLGVTFHEMICGKLPFETQDLLELIHAHLVKKPPNLHDINQAIPEALAAIIAKLLAKMPEDRYQSIIGLNFDLLTCQSEWQKNHQITPFVLGSQEVNDHLSISQKVYAREREVSQLLDSFEHISREGKELLLISGDAGIGKSSIVKEIIKSITARRGYFAKGKYDRLNRMAPYSAFIEAFQGLIHDLLSESDMGVLKLKEALLKVLSPNGQVIIHMIPEVALIIGEQPLVPDLPPDESQSRFMLVFHQFIRALASIEHPLVLFLDNLQWIDSASLELFKSLLLDRELHYFLLIGCYRNNEVNAEDPLMDVLKKLKIENVPMKELEIAPLTKNDIQNLLADSFNVTTIEVDDLAEVLLAKTQGNPFFINELLKKMYHENHLKFSYETRKWQWDLEQIRQEPVTENVVNLLVKRIQKLSKEVRELLEVCALMGHTFDLNTISVISGDSLAQTAIYILVSIEANLIAPVNDNSYRLLEGMKAEIVLKTDEKILFSFIHDNVQQAAYQLIPEEKKSQVHLRAGRFLLAKFQRKNLEKKDKRLFDVLYHFNQSIFLVTDNKECHQLSELNLLAGKKAKASIAYEDAVKYFESGLKFLKVYDWAKDYQLLFDFHLEISECLFLLNRFDDAEHYITESLKQCANVVDSGNIYFCKIKAYVNVARHREVIYLSKAVLKLFDFNLPVNPGVSYILKEIVIINWHQKMFGNSKIRIAATDEKILMIGKILTVVSASAYQVDQNLFAYLACKVLNFGFSKGYTPETPAACLGYAIILIAKFNKINEAFYFVELAKDLQKELGHRASISRNNFILGAFINHWKYPLKSSLEYMEKSYEAGIIEGNLAYSVYSRVMDLILYYVGKPLLEVKESVDKSISFLNYSENKSFYYFFVCMKDVILLLIEEDINVKEELSKMVEKICDRENKTTRVFAYIMCAELYYIKGDYQEAAEMSEKAYGLKDFVKGGFDFVFVSLFHGLCLSATYLTVNKAKQALYQKELKLIQKQFKLWSTHSSENFLYAYWLISAEIERLDKGFCIETIELYNKAISEAEEYNYTQFIAIANECAARFCFDSKYITFGKTYLQDAYYAYLQWGALAKCRKLEKKYSEVLQSHADVLSSRTSVSSTGMVASNLDVLSLFKATQAISGEIQLDKLLKKLMDILLQNAGAERAALLVKEDENWFVEAEGTLISQKITFSQADPLKNRSDLPLSLIGSVQRTQDVLLVRSAEDLDSSITIDLYLEQFKPQSILILPIFYQGVLKNILYLENRATSHAFTSASVQTLKVLASQASISLENARLYYQATHDPLTGLSNRNLLYQTFEMARARTKRAGKKIAILFLDLDDFKKINDTLGHEIGDLILIEFSEKIKTCLRDIDLIARLGGDEFVVMLEGTEFDETVLVVERILKIGDQPFGIQRHEVYINGSIGISFYPDDGSTIQELLKQADIALYKAKDTGKSNYQFYKPELNEQLQAENAQEIELRSALEKNELCLYYQPIFSSHERKIIHFEALIRWNHPVKGVILPKEFIPLAEKTGLILPVGDWILKEVFRQLKVWKEQGISLLPIAINISGVQFKKQRISKVIDRFLHDFQIESKYIQLEFTEGVFIDETEQVISDIVALKKLGVSLAIDDFGTFYSSLSYLKRFPVDKIKIDQSFVQGVEKNEEDRTLVLAIIAMAHSLKLKIIAEGVESELQAGFLEKNGADELQGFYLERPMDVEKCTECLKNRK